MVQIQRSRVRLSGAVDELDWIAAEEPLEVRIQGSAYAVLLRTPGNEPALVAGFLASESILGGFEDLAAIAPCVDKSSPPEKSNVWNVALAEGVSFAPGRRRVSIVGSTCGLCGVSSLAELQVELPIQSQPLPELGSHFFKSVSAEVEKRQAIWKNTAGVHAAAIALPADGKLLEFAEDVGRHNAVDKVIGARLLADDFPMESAAVLWVSGRISFEIVQKAAFAGLNVVVGAGVPTTLALETAKQAGITLFGRARTDSVNRYCGLTNWAGH